MEEAEVEVEEEEAEEPQESETHHNAIHTWLYNHGMKYEVKQATYAFFACEKHVLSIGRLHR